MNALVRQAAARKKQKASSALASEGRGVDEGKTHSESPVTIAEKPVTGASGSSYRKRRAPPTSVSSDPLVSSPELEEVYAESTPLRSVRPDAFLVSRCRTGLLELYHDDLRLVGVPPSPLGGSVMRDIPSRSDVDFIQNLGWVELNMRSNSASAEAAILNAEVTFRATHFRKQFLKDSRAFEKTMAELDERVSELTSFRDKEMAEAKRREEDMRMAFEADMLKLKNDLRVAEVRLLASKEKLRATEEDLRSARLDSDKAQADMARGAEVFEEAFLKSDKFGEIVGDKALGFLNVGFDGCVALFKAAGYPPEGASSDFLDIDKLSNNSKALVIADLTHVGQNSPYMISRDNIQNGTLSQIAESSANHSKKLQDDMQELGQKIKHHEDNVKYLKYHKNKLEESIVDMQVAIGKHYVSSSTEKEDPSQMKNEKKIIQNILKREGSAAALWYRMKNQPETKASERTLTKDVIGMVATLGMVDDDNLSRLLSEYLGLDTMLAIVCKTYEGVKALETYNRDGLIDKSLGLSALGASTGRPLDGRFRVICLEKLRPYVGDFIDDDPQQRLDLLKPRLVTGEIPPGFLGFAVNMITINSTNLNGISNDGRNLRESLFYNLFSNLQVYRSREDMLKALPFISNGAISLDGGVIKSPGVFDMGQQRGDMDVMFPNGSDRFNLPMNYFEIENHLKEAQWEKTRTMVDLQREQSLLDLSRFNYEKKKQEFVQFLAQSSSFAAQHKAGWESNPR